MESPPHGDFEWVELDLAPQHQSPSDVGDAGEEGQVKDGMASGVVGEQDGGYLGVASGAALLRMLEPSGRKRTFSNSSNLKMHARLTLQAGSKPSHCRHHD